MGIFKRCLLNNFLTVHILPLMWNSSSSTRRYIQSRSSKLCYNPPSYSLLTRQLIPRGQNPTVWRRYREHATGQGRLSTNREDSFYLRACRGLLQVGRGPLPILAGDASLHVDSMAGSEGQDNPQSLTPLFLLDTLRRPFIKRYSILRR
jgi:hypothetical protein